MMSCDVRKASHQGQYKILPPTNMHIARSIHVEYVLVLLEKYIMYELVCMLVLCGYSNSMHIMHTTRVCILDY